MELLIPLGSALWLGILTSISPCPLASNIAAITYIGNRANRPRQVFARVFLYTIGRVSAYLILAALLVASILSVPEVARFLQKYMNQLLGPILILAGMFLLELLRFGTGGAGMSEKLQSIADRSSCWWAFLLGFLFALSFCPISAALFFGSLIPLAISSNSVIMVPTVYGIGTGLPVSVFAILIAIGTHVVSKAFDKLSAVEFWARRVTGVVFILVGIYYCLTYIFGFDILWSSG